MVMLFEYCISSGGPLCFQVMLNLLLDLQRQLQPPRLHFRDEAVLEQSIK